MAARIWDPDKILGLGAWDGRGMFCVGRAWSKGGSRCRWRIEGNTFNRVSRILSDMSTMPPNEVRALLPQLARLSLCQDYHQNQAEEVRREWTNKLKDVIEQYENQQRVRDLEQQNDELGAHLETETMERRRLQDLIDGEAAHVEELRDEVLELRRQLVQARSTSNKYRTASVNAEQIKTSLQLRMREMETSLNNSTRSSQRLAEDLSEKTAEAANLRRRCEAENEAFENYKADAEESKAHLLLQINSLVSELQEERLRSDIRKKELEEAIADQTNLLAQTSKQQELLSTERQMSEGRKRAVSESKKLQMALRDKNKDLQMLLESERQNLERTRIALAAESATKEGIFRTEMETLRSQVTTERQTTKQLYGDLALVKEQNLSLSTQLAKIKDSLDRTQLDLENSLKVNEEQRTIAATRHAADALESARMLEHIRLLEAQISGSFRQTFTRKIRKMVECFPNWMGCWRRKKNNADLEEMQEGVNREQLV